MMFLVEGTVRGVPETIGVIAVIRVHTGGPSTGNNGVMN